MTETPWVLLQVCPNHIDGEVIAGRLRTESIPAQVEVLGALPGMEESVEVRVPQAWLARARALLAEPPPTDDELAELAIHTPPEEGAAD
jgi:hypothetical protein